MNRFAALLDALAYEPRRNGKLALLAAYFRTTPDPERGWALAAITGGLKLREAKAGLVRALISERVDPTLFALSYDFVGDLSETVALMWPASPPTGTPPPALSEVVAGLRAASRLQLPALVAGWLDELDETGRWALLKLITGGMRIGVSARLAKTAVAALGTYAPDDVEEVWHGLAPPYIDLFAWMEATGPRPTAVDPAPFRTPMLAHPLEDADFDTLDPRDFHAEWKWDGIRVQAASGVLGDGRRVARLFSRTGEDVSPAFPEIVDALQFDVALDGELLVRRDGRLGSFNDLQQRLNRKTVMARQLVDAPAFIRVYDLLALDGEDLRPLPFLARRARLEAAIAGWADPRLDLSPLLPFPDWDSLAAARADPAAAGAGEDAAAVEGCMLKRSDSPYLPGRPKGFWYKWKREPQLVDAVLMYAQRGHGKRSSFYSDYTFGVWRDDGEDRRLVPVGKAYSGFTDVELVEIDRFVRRNTINRFGPVREVAHGQDVGLVFEVAFEGLQRSTRHKSGLAMRFPRINRIRWDKPARDADEVGLLERLLERGMRTAEPTGT